MNRSARIAVTIACVVGGFGVLSLFLPQPRSVMANTQPVFTVANTSSNPVPTIAQGTTNVAGSVSLGPGSTVNVGNMPSVNVANTPTVNVGSLPTVQVGGTVEISGTPTVTLGNTTASPVNIAAATHFAQPEGNLVTIFGSSGANAPFYRVLSDGTFQNNWVVPARQMFVITDWSWSTFACGAGFHCLATLQEFVSGTGSIAMDQSGATADAFGGASAERQVTIVMAPGAQPQWLIQGAGVGGGFVYIHGYLTQQ